MTTIRPNAEQIAKLTVRSIVAYASRAARRAIATQNADDIESCERALRVANEFVEEPTVVSGSERRAALAAASASDRGPTESLPLIHVTVMACAAMMCCYYAIRTVCSKEPERATCFKRLVDEAVRAARPLDDEASAALDVADYELLVKLYGKHESITLGDPFDPSDSGPLGPIL